MKLRAHRSHLKSVGLFSNKPTELDVDLLEKLPNFMISSNTKDPRENDKDEQSSPKTKDIQ